MKRTDIIRMIETFFMWGFYIMALLGVTAKIIDVAPRPLMPLFTCLFAAGAIALTIGCYYFARTGSWDPREKEEIVI